MFDRKIVGIEEKFCLNPAVAFRRHKLGFFSLLFLKITFVCAFLIYVSSGMIGFFVVTKYSK